MGGGLIQLMAIGPQNKKICGNPKISFFKHVYSQYCNFGIEWFYQYFEGTKKLGKTIKCKLDKKGDLLRQMYVVFEISTDSLDIPKLGLRLIDYVEIQIGGQIIDRHYGEWMDIWTQLNYSAAKYEMFKTLMMDKYHAGTTSNTNLTDKCGNSSYKRVYVPLIFWFNLNPGLALPLVALQYHEVYLYLKLKSKENLATYTTLNMASKQPLAADSDNNLYYENGILMSSSNTGGVVIKNGVVDTAAASPVVYDFTAIKSDSKAVPPHKYKWHKTPFNGELKDVYLMCEYIFLDTTQRKGFVAADMEYLITQVQYSGKLDLNKLTKTAAQGAGELTLNFNHPVKEIILSVYPSWLDNMLMYKNMDNSYTATSLELFANNSKITEIDNIEFYTLLNPFEHYECGGFSSSSSRHTNFNGGFYYYSFAINPSSPQPTGSLNFSKLNNFTMNFIYNKSANSVTEIDEPFKMFAFGRNYNILKIKDGMGGVLYSS
tara:strand:- start:890 stop:2353 length:1464 start_codon:yes stop_codon:yes gene_type:complete